MFEVENAVHILWTDLVHDYNVAGDAIMPTWVLLIFFYLRHL